MHSVYDLFVIAPFTIGLAVVGAIAGAWSMGQFGFYVLGALGFVVGILLDVSSNVLTQRIRTVLAVVFGAVVLAAFVLSR